MSKTLYYAGIGSRETPVDIISQMMDIATELAKHGWVLRSGHADGADQAFETGCVQGNGKMEIMLPWKGFNKAPFNNPSYIVPHNSKELEDFTASFHPAWHRCTRAAKLLHMRNSWQILGEHTNAQVEMVICWTKGGKRGGGTGQALRIAEFYKIPIFDLALPETVDKLTEFVNKYQ